MFGLYVCKNTMCILSPYSQRRALDSLGLEIQMLVSHLIGAGNQTFESSLHPQKNVITDKWLL